MNICRKTLVAGAVALAMACGGAYAQSTSGGSAGSSGSAQGQAGQRQGGAQGAMGGANGMNGANGANGMKGSTEGCANRASTAAGNVAEANRPPGSPVQGAASKGSTDWSDQANCANQQGGYGKHSGAAQNPRNGGG